MRTISHINRRGETTPAGKIEGRQIRGSTAFRATRAFTLVEVIVVMGLLLLIVTALMAVFSNTQRAFRSSITQSDILENGRATMEMIAQDLRGMTPSYGYSEGTNNALLLANDNCAVNFFATNNSIFYAPLTQQLIGADNGAQHTNLLEYFFILGRQNTSWIGTGYIVNTYTASSSSLYPLYRFTAQTNIENNPLGLFYDFQREIVSDQWTNMSHLMDGVVGLTVRAFDTNGVWLTNGYNFSLGQSNVLKNTWFTPPYPGPGGEVGFTFYSNAVPASVQIEMATLEDRTLQRAESLGISTLSDYTNVPALWNYLSGHANAVHIFRQRVSISLVDPTAYQ
ncbi:MAG TPA: hypothetical protein VGI03_07720 [Verrucomicrobiae bacterium]|jgi:type II secretory pathway pseudopilin PulG